MSAKKTLCMLFAGTLFAAAMPAFAHHEFRGDPRFDPRFERPVAVQPVYQDYRGYRGHPVYAQPVYAPAPVYAHRSHDNRAIGAVGGAAIGAMIGSNFGYGQDRTAAMAAGAIIGGLLGHELAR